MHDDKRRQQRRCDEMNGTRRLPSAKKVHQPMEFGVDPRRHREPGHDHQRQQDENHRKITQLLKDIVLASLLAMRETKTKMVKDGTAEIRKLHPRRRQVPPRVAAREAVNEVNQSVRNEEPSEKEMPAAAGREVAVARQRRPG